MKQRNKFGLGIASFGLSALLGGCADFWNKADNQGVVVFSKNADYIVVKQSGGVITDVYKLRDVIVSSAEHSDGWIFKDQSGNSINIGGDMKAIRIIDINKDLSDKYCEYHMEFEGGRTYFDVCEKR